MGEPARRAMTADEFMAWDDGTDTRYELIDGTIVAMAPPPMRTAPSRSMSASRSTCSPALAPAVPRGRRGRHSARRATTTTRPTSPPRAADHEQALCRGAVPRSSRCISESSERDDFGLKAAALQPAAVRARDLARSTAASAGSRSGSGPRTPGSSTLPHARLMLVRQRGAGRPRSSSTPSTATAASERSAPLHQLRTHRVRQRLPALERGDVRQRRVRDRRSAPRA